MVETPEPMVGLASVSFRGRNGWPAIAAMA
jgi:hypothetical protein